MVLFGFVVLVCRENWSHPKSLLGAIGDLATTGKSQV
jgi:hypothetical protein